MAPGAFMGGQPQIRFSCFGRARLMQIRIILRRALPKRAAYKPISASENFSSAHN